MDELKEFQKYNGFYKSKKAREVLYSLYKGKCAANNKSYPIELCDIGHIVPQSQSELFESLYPGLDVHNIINLQLLSQSANRGISNFFPKSPLAIWNAISYNIGLIKRRLPKIEKDPNETSINIIPNALALCSFDLTVNISEAYETAHYQSDFHILEYKKLLNCCEKTLKNKSYTVADFNFSVTDAQQDNFFFEIKNGKIISASATNINQTFSSTDLEEFCLQAFNYKASNKNVKELVDLKDGKYIAFENLNFDQRETFKVNFQNKKLSPYVGLLNIFKQISDLQSLNFPHQNPKLFYTNKDILNILNPLYNENYVLSRRHPEVRQSLELPTIGLYEAGKLMYANNNADYSCPKNFSGSIVIGHDWKKFCKGMNKIITKKLFNTEKDLSIFVNTFDLINK